MSVMIFLCGVLGILVATVCYMIPAIRKVATIVPDFQLPEESNEGAVGSAAEDSSPKALPG